MLFSKSLIPTLKVNPKDVSDPAHTLLLRSGYIRMVTAGIYEMLPLGQRVLLKVVDIIRRHMNQAGAQEILMPILCPASFFRETGRFDDYGSVLFRLQDRKQSDYHLAPTHEEIITDLARKEIKSYQKLPQILYQIQMKFRDEPRPRAGLLRCREFLMKDAYSFDESEAKAQETYQHMTDVYHQIFHALGLNYRMVQADSGQMGGSKSVEFQILSSNGEDKILMCNTCDYSANMETHKGLERSSKPDSDAICPACNNILKQHDGIEGGHVFLLGTHYSAKMNAFFSNKEGAMVPFFMGCYGIGITRMAQAVASQHHDEAGLVWPMSIAPYEAELVSLSHEETLMEKASHLYHTCKGMGIDLLWDDRKERAGIKFADADLIGIPFRIDLGPRGLAQGTVELIERASHASETCPIEQLPTLLMKRIQERKTHIMKRNDSIPLVIFLVSAFIAISIIGAVTVVIPELTDDSNQSEKKEPNTKDIKVK